MAILRRVLLLQRDVPRAAVFYSDGLGMKLLSCTREWAELEGAGGGAGTRVALKAVEGEAAATTGYSPFLTFDVPDLDATLPRLLAMGAVMDGGVKFGQAGRSAVLRAPDGHMIGLVEGAEGPRPGGQ